MLFLKDSDQNLICPALGCCLQALKPKLLMVQFSKAILKPNQFTTYKILRMWCQGSQEIDYLYFTKSGFETQPDPTNLESSAITECSSTNLSS